MAQNIAKSLFEMERIDVRIEHALEFSIKIVLSILKIGFEPDFVAFPVLFTQGYSSLLYIPITPVRGQVPSRISNTSVCGQLYRGPCIRIWFSVDAR